MKKCCVKNLFVFLFVVCFYFGGVLAVSLQDAIQKWPSYPISDEQKNLRKTLIEKDYKQANILLDAYLKNLGKNKNFLDVFFPYSREKKSKKLLVTSLLLVLL